MELKYVAGYFNQHGCNSSNRTFMELKLRWRIC